MRKTIFLLSCVFACARVAGAASLYSNLLLDGRMAAASRPDLPGAVEIEAADDFILGSGALVTKFKFIGLVTGGSINDINAFDTNLEIYRVFPNDSNASRTPQVPTRNNSPSDVAFAERTFAGLQSFTITQLATNVTASNSVKNGIN